MAVAAEAFEQSNFAGMTQWQDALDRVDVYLSGGSYTATVIRASERAGGDESAASTPIRNRNGELKRWRDLDNLVGYVLRNVSKQPSIFVHTGATPCN